MVRFTLFLCFTVALLAIFASVILILTFAPWELLVVKFIFFLCMVALGLFVFATVALLLTFGP